MRQTGNAAHVEMLDHHFATCWLRRNHKCQCADCRPRCEQHGGIRRRSVCGVSGTTGSNPSGQGRPMSVSNAGISGDTTGGMLARLSSAVPAGNQDRHSADRRQRRDEGNEPCDRGIQPRRNPQAIARPRHQDHRGGRSGPNSPSKRVARTRRHSHDGRRPAPCRRATGRVYSLEHDPEKCVLVFPRDKREAFARRSCSNNWKRR